VVQTNVCDLHHQCSIQREQDLLIDVQNKMHSRCFGIMGGHGNFMFNLIVNLSVELGYVFISLRL
jgi:hypothetical protein